MLKKETIIWLSQKQKKLDEYIEKNKNLVVDDIILDKKILAFLVELGEYANEERCFKYWSNKKEAELSIQLDEYIDGIHFIISIGNQIGFNFEQVDNIKIENKSNFIENYFNLIEKISNFIKDKNYENFNIFLNYFLNIADIKNYSEEQIINAYILKNEINFKRQDSNY